MAELKVNLNDDFRPVEQIPPARRDVEGNARKLLAQLGSNQESAAALSLVTEALKAEWTDGWLARSEDVRRTKLLTKWVEDECVKTGGESMTPCPRCGGFHARMDG